MTDVEERSGLVRAGTYLGALIAAAANAGETGSTAEIVELLAATR